MAYPTNKQQYTGSTIRKYIKYYYFRAQDFRALIYDDEDGPHHLGEFYDGLGGEKNYENKIIDIINFAKRRNKLEKLLDLLRLGNPNFDHEIVQFAPKSTLSSQLSTVAGVGSGRAAEKSWVKSSKIQTPVVQAKALPHGQNENPKADAGRSAVLGVSPQNLERLGLHVALLEEINSLLEGIQKKISELNLNIDLQTLSSPENVSAASKFTFQGKQTGGRQSALTRPTLHGGFGGGSVDAKFP